MPEAQTTAHGHWIEARTRLAHRPKTLAAAIANKPQPTLMEYFLSKALPVGSQVTDEVTAAPGGCKHGTDARGQQGAWAHASTSLRARDG